MGHHSEKRHRRDVEKWHEAEGKGHEMAKEAQRLEARVEAATSNRAISSDDPEAVALLRVKLAKLETDQALAVAVNKAVKKKDARAALAALGLKEKTIEAALKPDFMGRIGVPSFAMQNGSSEIRRVKQRIEDLEKKAATPAPEAVEVGGVRIEEADNRVRIVFPGKPDSATIAKLKGAGFRWAPSEGAWQRMASNGAWYHAKAIVGGG